MFEYRVSYVFKESVQVQSFPRLQHPCILDMENDHDSFITKCMNYFRKLIFIIIICYLQLKKLVINCERVAMKSKEFEKRLNGVRKVVIDELFR
jgi:hypothetical protein